MPKTKRSYHIILLLILAGESIFILPFVLARIFRPTFLEVFQIDNTQLGYCFSIYGIVALLSYLLGGPLADRFEPRKLMAFAIWFTALGGLYMASFPPYFMLKLLFGCWGFTTIFLFWAPMIKATRMWGENKSQNRAFGFLDGGRGLVAASFGTLGILIFSNLLPADENAVNTLQRQGAFRMVILISSLVISLVGVLVYIFLTFPEDKIAEDRRAPMKNIKETIGNPSVLLLMVIVLCAYVAYKVTDIFSLYAKDVMQYSEINSANLASVLLYMRPIIGVSLGLFAGRFKSSKLLLFGFGLVLISASLFSLGYLHEHRNIMFLISIICMALGTYAARCLYFAMLKEGNIPLKLTGTAVGLISLIGYTPDIFMGPSMGYFLDNYEGIWGHQQVFILLSVFMVIGIICSALFYRRTSHDSTTAQ